MLAWCPSIAHAEGSVDVNTGTNPAMYRHILTMTTTALSPPYTVLRVYANAGERIEMGSSAMGLGGQADILVYPPGSSFGTSTGAIAPLAHDFPFATPIFDCNTDDSTPGRGVLNTRAKELAGPGGASGYSPCSFRATQTGIYAVILFSIDPAGVSSVPSGTIGTPNVTANQKTYLSLWDVTVVRADGTRAKGRVFTNIIGLRAFNNQNPPAPGMANFHGYVLTDRGYVYEFTFFNHSGINWALLSDSHGVVVGAIGKPLYASFSYEDAPAGAEHSEAAISQGREPDQAIDPRYPIFFNPPDPVVISGEGGLGSTGGTSAVPQHHAAVGRHLRRRGRVRRAGADDAGVRRHALVQLAARAQRPHVRHRDRPRRQRQPRGSRRLRLTRQPAERLGQRRSLGWQDRKWCYARVRDLPRLGRRRTQRCPLLPIRR